MILVEVEMGHLFFQIMVARRSGSGTENMLDGD